MEELEEEEDEDETSQPPIKKRGRPERERRIEVGDQVHIMDGASQGLVGEVSGYSQSWTRVALENGSVVSVRRMHLALVGARTSVLTHAEGYELYLSDRPSGYMGVQENQWGKFQAYYAGKYLGIAHTASDAAVLYAKAKEAAEAEEEHR